MKQETLGDAAAEYSNKNYATKDLLANEDWYISWLAFNNGGKWQAERMYSEEELKYAIEVSVAKALGVMNFTINEESFKQFKKK
jgi:hypothetical protein